MAFFEFWCRNLVLLGEWIDIHVCPVFQYKKHCYNRDLYNTSWRMLQAILKASKNIWTLRMVWNFIFWKYLKYKMNSNFKNLLSPCRTDVRVCPYTTGKFWKYLEYKINSNFKNLSSPCRTHMPLYYRQVKAS